MELFTCLSVWWYTVDNNHKDTTVQVIIDLSVHNAILEYKNKIIIVKKRACVCRTNWKLFLKRKHDDCSASNNKPKIVSAKINANTDVRSWTSIVPTFVLCLFFFCYLCYSIVSLFSYFSLHNYPHILQFSSYNLLHLQ